MPRIQFVLSALIFTFASALGTSAISQSTASKSNPSPHANGPFGFFSGETREQVISAIGKSSIEKSEGDILQVSKAPKSHPEFESYLLVISPKLGLLKVTAVGKNIENDASGIELRSRFDRLKNALTVSYGAPSNSYDFLHTGSIWHEPNEFMMSLYKKERSLASFWTDGEYPNQISLIMLESKGLGQSTGYVVIGYEFKGFEKYVDHRTDQEDSVL